MKITLSDQAKQDMKWWRSYYKKTFPQGKANAAAHLSKAVELLQLNPLMGRAVEGHNLRRYPIHRTPFAFIYRATDNEIQIARVWDGRKDPQKMQVKE